MASGFHVVRIRGHIDIARYPEFRGAFTSVAHDVPVLIDLREASGVDSTFLSEMLLFKRRHVPPMAVVVTPETHLARVFSIAGMDAKIGVYHSRADALRAIGVEDDERSDRSEQDESPSSS
ncbi:MAG: hypothetical protein NVS3B7_14070 [Candidatus Elarobacter sp.]